MNNNKPKPLRCAALVLLSLVCAALLIELDASTPWPPTNPATFADWWERHGTAAAAITLLRVLGSTLAGWGIFIGAAGLLASIRPSGLLHGVWCRVTPSSFRKILAAGAITITLSAPAIAGAGTQSVNAQIILEDLGGIEDAESMSRRSEDLNQADMPARPVLTDLGPRTVETTREPTPETVILPNLDISASGHTDSAGTLLQGAVEGASESAGELASGSQLWTVSEGDHLWKIAMKTLRDHGYGTEPATIVDYWRQLINTNSEALNGDPDLIHPGMVLILPPVPSRS